VSETTTQKQVRLLLETQCRDAANLLAKHLPAGTAFALVIADFGEKGNVAYVSSAERDDMIRMFEELLTKWKATA
jgi:membrane carboxypeptidase/penicillin-binding protein PbpC